MAEAVLTPSAGSSEGSAPTSGASGTSSATPTPSERPTFAQAFASDAASQAPAATQPEGATTPPVAETTPTGEQQTTPAPEGPIPFAVHKQTLENARAKERQAVTAELQPRLQSLDAWSPIAQRMVENPIQFIRDYTAEIAQRDPTLATQLRSEAARVLGQRQPQGPPPPDTQIVNEHGQVVGMTYSDKQQAAYHAWNNQQLLAKVQAELAPFKQEREQRQQTEAQQQLSASVNAAADGILAEVSDILDGDHSLMSEVAAQMDANPKLSAHAAALAVRKAKITPQSQAKAQAAVLESMKTKAAANGVNPAGGAVTSTKRPTSFNDPSLKWS
jgi:hypothetical protein